MPLATWNPADTDIPPPPDYEVWTPADTDIPPPPGYIPPRGALGHVGRALQDISVAALKGAVGLPQAITGLADLVSPVDVIVPPGTPANFLLKKAVDAAGIPQYGLSGWMQEKLGLDYAEAQNILGEFYSPETQAGFAEISEAEGVLGKAGAAIRNPATILTSAGEAIPSMLAGGAIGRAVKALPVIGKFAAGIGEGVIAAGAGAEQVRAETPTGFLTEKQASIQAASGALTGLIGVLGAKFTGRLGIDDIDVLLAGAKTKASQSVRRNVVMRVMGGAVSEGFIEELPQSFQEQVAQNISLGKPWHEGVEESAAMGTLVGGLMGGGANLIQTKPSDPSITQADHERVQALPANLEAGGTVSRKDAEAFEKMTGVKLPKG